MKAFVAWVHVLLLLFYLFFSPPLCGGGPFSTLVSGRTTHSVALCWQELAPCLCDGSSHWFSAGIILAMHQLIIFPSCTLLHLLMMGKYGCSPVSYAFQWSACQDPGPCPLNITHCLCSVLPGSRGLNWIFSPMQELHSSAVSWWVDTNTPPPHPPKSVSRPLITDLLHTKCYWRTIIRNIRHIRRKIYMEHQSGAGKKLNYTFSCLSRLSSGCDLSSVRNILG